MCGVSGVSGVIKWTPYCTEKIISRHRKNSGKMFFVPSGIYQTRIKEKQRKKTTLKKRIYEIWNEQTNERMKKKLEWKWLGYNFFVTYITKYWFQYWPNKKKEECLFPSNIYILPRILFIYLFHTIKFYLEYSIWNLYFTYLFHIYL